MIDTSTELFNWSEENARALLVGKASENTLPKDAILTAQIELRISETTTEAELKALKNCTGKLVSDKQYRAFCHSVESFSPSEIVAHNLFDKCPHMKDLSLIPDPTVRQKLQNMLEELDLDQRKAFQELERIPEATFWLPGGPGGGKTKWALTVAALAMAGQPRTKVLYLVDINKPLTETANKMGSLVKSLGLKNKVVRMYVWPEARRRKGICDAPRTPKETREYIAAYLNGAAKRAKSAANDGLTVETLDDVVLAPFRTDPDAFPALRDVGQSKPDEESGIELEQFEDLYRQGLEQVDFIATTPVAARWGPHSMWQPDIVIFDEAAHARELSTLISVAFYNPSAWIFLGDHHQTQPFFRSTLPEAQQLGLSTLERKARRGEITHQLLVNHRARGDLHEMASEIIYDGKMRSGLNVEDQCPPSTHYLQQWLVDKGFLTSPNSRVILDIPWSEEKSAGNGQWHNPCQRWWVTTLTQELLDDKHFTTTDGKSPGTILIIVPYRTAAARYSGFVNGLSTEAESRRVKVRTTGTVQGEEADVVFFDHVRTVATGHTDDKNKLCVSITRARQAEIIVMTENAAKSKAPEEKGARRGTTTWLKKVWDYCESRDLVFKKEVPVS